MPVICGGECTGRRHPRERERWHALWLLVQGWTAVAVAEALGRDAHTIGRWVAVFGEGGPGALAFEQSSGTTRDRRSAVDRTEGNGAGVSSKGWPRLGQLELEGGAQICAGTFQGLPKPQQLPELPPSTRGQALPGYLPDFNADEAIWNWVRQEVTANLCLGTKSAVQEKVNNFFTQLAGNQRSNSAAGPCSKPRAEGLLGKAYADPRRPTNVDPTLVSV